MHWPCICHSFAMRWVEAPNDALAMHLPCISMALFDAMAMQLPYNGLRLRVIYLLSLSRLLPIVRFMYWLFFNVI